VTLYLLLTNLDTVRFADLPFTGFLYAVGAGVATQVGGLFYNTSLSTGPTSAVSAVAGSYPAVVYLVNFLTGQEGFSGMKTAGVALAVGSGICFSMA